MRFYVALTLVAACGSPSGTPDAPANVPDVSSNGADAPAAPRRLRGTNMSGAEFGEQNLPGTFGTDYIYPDPAYATGYTSQDYFIAKGMNTFRLAFRWERLQRQLNAALDTTGNGKTIRPD